MLDTDLEVAFAALAGPLFFRRLVLRQRTDRDQVEELIEQVLDGMTVGDRNLVAHRPA